MNVSSIGTTQTQALASLFSYLNSTSSTSSTSDTSSTTDLASDTLSISSQAQAMSQVQGSDPFQTDFANLGKLIQSGDLAGAQKAYAAMQQKMQANQPAGSGSV